MWSAGEGLPPGAPHCPQGRLHVFSTSQVLADLSDPHQGSQTLEKSLEEKNQDWGKLTLEEIELLQEGKGHLKQNNFESPSMQLSPLRARACPGGVPQGTAAPGLGEGAMALTLHQEPSGQGLDPARLLLVRTLSRSFQQPPSPSC